MAAARAVWLGWKRSEPERSMTLWSTGIAEETSNLVLYLRDQDGAALSNACFNVAVTTTDGPGEPASCSLNGCYSDVWYRYTATSSGSANVSSMCSVARIGAPAAMLPRISWRSAGGSRSP